MRISGEPIDKSQSFGIALLHYAGFNTESGEFEYQNKLRDSFTIIAGTDKKIIITGRSTMS